VVVGTHQLCIAENLHPLSTSCKVHLHFQFPISYVVSGWEQYQNTRYRLLNLTTSLYYLNSAVQDIFMCVELVLSNWWFSFPKFSSKLISLVVSLFSASYAMKWTQFFPETELQYAATFDGRAVCYPSESILRDYLSWRQVDCEWHVVNLSLMHANCARIW